MKNRPPAFQVYANEALARTFGLTLGAVGAIHRIELAMWAHSADHSSIADDDILLARTVGVPLMEWKSFRDEIQHEANPYFETQNGRLVSSYLRQEAAKQRKFRKLQSEKGKRSAEQRFNRGSTAVQPRGNSSSSFSSSSSTSEELREERIARPAKPVRAVKVVDEAFVLELKKNPAYQGINIDVELGKLQAWLQTPKGRGKHVTKARFVNWLNKAQPMHSSGNGRAMRSGFGVANYHEGVEQWPRT